MPRSGVALGTVPAHEQKASEMSFITDDLKYAQAAGVCVDVQLLSGGTMNTQRVHEVNNEAGYVSFFAPQVFGDSTTTQKFALDLIASVTVTDVEWT